MSLIFPLDTRAQLRFSGVFLHDSGYTFTPPQQLITSRNLIISEVSRSEERLQFHWSTFLLQPIHQRFDSLSLRINEMYVDLFFSNADLRIGRQHLAFGLGDFSPVSSFVTPLDVRDFLTLESTHLRLGTDAIHLRYFLKNSDIQFALTSNSPDWLLPNPDSPWFPNLPVPDDLDIRFEKAKSNNRLRDIQFAMQWNLTSFFSTDIALKLLHWKNVTPVYFKYLDFPDPDSLPEQIIFEWRSFNSLMPGLSVQHRFGDGWSLRTEHLYRFSQHFDEFPDEIRVFEQNEIPLQELVSAVDTLLVYNERGFLTESSQLFSTLGVQFQRGSFVIDAQANLQFMPNYTPTIVQEELFWSVSLLVREQLFRDLLTIQVLSLINGIHQDFFIHPMVRYEIMDNFFIESGAYVFGGKSTPFPYGHLSFHNFSSNSFGYARFSFFW